VAPPQGEWALTLAFHSHPCRVWYMNGNYLVILVSVTIILPLALMRQLGGCGRVQPWRGCEKDTQKVPVSQPLLLCRLSGLRQWLLSQLHGVLPNCSESPSMFMFKKGQPPRGVLCPLSVVGGICHRSRRQLLQS
jgi:hypothetical protein